MGQKFSSVFLRVRMAARRSASACRKGDRMLHNGLADACRGGEMEDAAQEKSLRKDAKPRRIEARFLAEPSAEQENPGSQEEEEHGVNRFRVSWLRLFIVPWLAKTPDGRSEIGRYPRTSFLCRTVIASI